MTLTSFHDTPMSKHAWLFFLIIFAAILVLLSDSVVAGAGGAEFDDVWTQVKDWTQGTLGRIAAGGMILVGTIMGIARQSLMPLATGVGSAMGLYNSPTVVESIMSATLPMTVHTADAAFVLQNGLL